MNDRAIHIPLDLESRTQFRILEGKLGKEKALGAVFILFRVLGYAAQEGERVGWLRGERVGLLTEDLKFKTEELVGSFLEESEGGYFCKVFASENEHLALDFQTIQQRGGMKRAIMLKRRDAEVDGVKQMQMLQKDLFANLTVDGRSLSSDEKKRRMMVIKFLDNMLGRKDRLTSEFTEGLVADAHRVVAMFSDHEIEELGTHLYRNRGGAVRPQTEEVLRDFETYVRAELAA